MWKEFMIESQQLENILIDYVMVSPTKTVLLPVFEL